MSKDEFLERARGSLQLARLCHGLRDVSAEIADVRLSLAACGGQPASIEVTEIELVELVRRGYMSEARITFDMACCTKNDIEKEFFFSELVALVTKAAFAASPAPPTVRENTLACVLVEDSTCGTDVEALKAEKRRLMLRIPFLDQRIAMIRSETDRQTAEYLQRIDPFITNERSGAQDLMAVMGGIPDEAIAELDFSRFENGSTFDVRNPNGQNDQEIELSATDLEPCPEFEIVEGSPVRDDYAVRFLEKKDAISLGIVAAPAASRAMPPPPPADAAEDA